MFSVSNANTGVQLHSSSHARRSLKKPLRNTRSEEPKYKPWPPPKPKPCPPPAPTRRYQFEELSDTSDNLNFAELNIEPMDNMHLLKLKVLREGSPSLFPNLNELCWLDLSYCESLTSLPTELFKLKFVKKLYLCGCSNLEQFPEIEETMENLTVLILDETAIKELPSSLHHLVGLEELSLHNCQQLEIIPSSVGSLTKFCKLDLSCCESLETIPSSIFQLKLTKLDLHGCSMLKTFPEILEPAETFAHINLTKTAIKELPSSLDYLVGLQTLRLNLCSDLVSLPNSIVNLNHLSQLDCSGCRRLTKIPDNIGRLSSLRELSLQESGIVDLPKSIAHLSSLKSLDLSDCRMLECIPQLPPFLNQLLAYDCPLVRRVMSNSRLKLPSDSKEGTFKFHLTNSQELDAGAHSNIWAEAWLRITQDAYRFVFFCFPGSAVPRWFPYRCQGHLITVKNDSIYLCNDNNRLIGFALCVVLGSVDMDDTQAQMFDDTYDTEDSDDIEGGSHEDMEDTEQFDSDTDDTEGGQHVDTDDAEVNLRAGVVDLDPNVVDGGVYVNMGNTTRERFIYRITFESDGRTHILPNHDNKLRNCFIWKGRDRLAVKDHTFLWKYHLDFASNDERIFRAESFTFEIGEGDHRQYFNSKSNVTVKDCGICPLYAKEKDDDNGLRFSNNDIEKPSGSKAA